MSRLDRRRPPLSPRRLAMSLPSDVEPRNALRPPVLVALSFLLVLAAGSALPTAQAAPWAQGPETSSFDRWVRGPVSLLLTDDEKLMLSHLDPDDEDLFRQWFWSRRDPQPDLPRNSFREQFRVRLGVVQKRYDRDDGAGWNTAPGIIYLLLGKPNRVQEVKRHTGSRRVEVWRYRPSGTALRERSLDVYFVETDEGLALVPEGEFGHVPRAVRLALKDAVESAVRRPELPFPGSLEPVDPEPLPVRGVLHPVDDEVEARMALSPGDLYGEPVGDDLKVELELTLLSSGEGSVPLAPGPTTPLSLELTLQASDLAPGSRRAVHVVARFDAAAPGVEALRVVEMASGRTGTIRATGPAGGSSPQGREPIGETPRTVDADAPDCIQRPVARLLDTARAGDSALAVAFVTEPTDGPPRAKLWLSREPGPADAEVLRDFGHDLYLLRRAERGPDGPGPPRDCLRATSTSTSWSDRKAACSPSSPAASVQPCSTSAAATPGRSSPGTSAAGSSTGSVRISRSEPWPATSSTRWTAWLRNLPPLWPGLSPTPELPGPGPGPGCSVEISGSLTRRGEQGPDLRVLGP